MSRILHKNGESGPPAKPPLPAVSNPGVPCGGWTEMWETAAKVIIKPPIMIREDREYPEGDPGTSTRRAKIFRRAESPLVVTETQNWKKTALFTAALIALAVLWAWLNHV